MRYNLKGPNHSPATACATGLHAIGDAAVLISCGLCDVMVAGATETCIHPLAISGLCKTKALSTKYNSNPIKASRPFDSKRDGFVMSEGAGLVVLEELEHALNRRSKIYAEILGYGLLGNAYHVTAPSEMGEGVARSMLSALKDAHLSPEDIGHINAHATSTLLGDSAENAAIKLVFNDHSANMFISANKGSIGHLLRAAGSVEAIFTILAVNEGVAPPTINLDEKEDEFDLNYCESGPQEWRVTGEQRIRVAPDPSYPEVSRTIFNKLFDIVDTNHSGVISFHQFAVYFKFMGIDESAAEISFGALDANKDGEISREEFSTAANDFTFGLDESSKGTHFYGPLVV